MIIANSIMSILSCGISISYLLLTILNMEKEINPWNNFITAIILSVVSIILLVVNFIKKQDKKMYIVINPIFLIIAIVPLLIKLNIFKLPEKQVIGNLRDKSISEVLEWAKENNVDINYTTEYSDNIDENNIISQDVDSSTLINDVKNINLVISGGPNYDKEIIIPNMIGWTDEKVIEYINENYLNNVSINFTESEYEKNTVIEQSLKGNAKRNSNLTLTFSYGLNKPDSTELKNIVGLSKFDAEFYLKQNAIDYELKYDFSDEVLRNYVVSASKNENDVIKSDEKLVVNISKGKAITIPDFYSMTTDEINTFIIDNKLKVSYDDKYDDKTPLGSIISVDKNNGDTVEEATTINIILSKGQLKMEEFNNLNDFKDWANKYGIKYSEEYEFNSSSNGTIIGFSASVGDVIGNDETVVVKISKGPSVSIPSFVGMSKNDISKKCNDIGLTCKFSYSGYSSTAYDTAVSQSRTGGEVERGTVVTVYLSLGKAKSWTLDLQSNWFTGGSTSATISTLTNILSKNYPGVNFKYVVKASNSGPSGGYHESSPCKIGSTITQGQTCEIWIKQ